MACCMQDTSSTIKIFSEVTQTDDYVALAYLKENGWNLEISVEKFLEEKIMTNCYQITSNDPLNSKKGTCAQNLDLEDNIGLLVDINSPDSKEEIELKIKEFSTISCTDDIVSKYYLQKNAWDFQKSLDDIIEDRFQDYQEINCPTFRTDSVEISEKTLVKSTAFDDRNIVKDVAKESVAETTLSNVEYGTLSYLLRQKLFQKRVANAQHGREKLKRKNAMKVDRPYDYNAIGGSGDRMIAGGMPNGDIAGNALLTENRDSNTNSDFSNVSKSSIESMKIRRENILSELVETESKYVIDIKEVLINYRDKLAVSNLTETRQRANTIFGNLDEIHEFHNSTLYPELERCGSNPASVARVFITYCQTIKSLYSAYCQNMSASRQAVANLGGETTPTSILLHCQQEAGHQLPLTSYLLKPMQRLTKYQLLLKYLTEASDIVSGRVELDEALDELVTVVKVVNDSLHNITIKGLPSAAQPLGALVTHDIFTVTSENGKSSLTGAQILLLRGNRGQRRHVFLYENHVVFAKVVSEKSQVYGFKFCLATGSLGMSSVVKGEDKKIDLWLLGRNSDSYTLEAKTKKAKDEFASELRKVIVRQKDRNKSASSRGGSLSQKYAIQNQNQLNEVQTHHNPSQQAAYYDTASTTCSGESGDSQGGDRLSRHITRSRSLESGRVHAPLRSRSVDCAADRNSPIDDDELGVDEDDDAESGGSAGAGGVPRTRVHRNGGRYIALADYMALTSREIDLTEDEVVELVKVGCAGWWYVRLTTYPYPEGWTPSTYLEKLHERI